MVYFQCRYQYLSKLLTLCVLLGFAAVWGCSELENQNEFAPPTTETSHAISREMVAEVLAEVEKNVFAAEMEITPQVAAAPMAPMQRPPTIAETMAALRLEFPGNVLDEDFTKIREIINSETYVEFLKRTYPQENQFQNFDEFWELASVDTEAYLEFLNTYFKPPHAAPTAADVSVLHYMTMVDRHVNVRLYHGEDKKRDMFFDMMSNDLVESWLEQHFFTGDDTDLLLMMEVLVNHAIWVDYLQEKDQESVQALFLEHGRQKGFLRVALEEPVRLGYILKDFTDTQVFKRWVDGEFSKNAGQQGQRPDNVLRALGVLQ
ncbi:hypothetical protein F4054_10740 [Candidatus Poribacteria bacterium]|nr:hypothetical protein [Candidatus Poribacteria bacterium]MYG07691.1 hypothetical protein [Candidatus Poribacteria bacterium]MYK22721.1 hypothetical protein [Candidatus Poribacteria bacterium]